MKPYLLFAINPSGGRELAGYICAMSIDNAAYALGAVMTGSSLLLPLHNGDYASIEIKEPNELDCMLDAQLAVQMLRPTISRPRPQDLARWIEKKGPVI